MTTLYDAAASAAQVAAMIDHHLSPLTTTPEGQADALLREARQAIDCLIEALAQLNPAIVAATLVLGGQMTPEEFERVMAVETLKVQNIEVSEEALVQRISELRTAESFVSPKGDK